MCGRGECDPMLKCALRCVNFSHFVRTYRFRHWNGVVHQNRCANSSLARLQRQKNLMNDKQVGLESIETTTTWCMTSTPTWDTHAAHAGSMAQKRYCSSITATACKMKANERITRRFRQTNRKFFFYIPLWNQITYIFCALCLQRLLSLTHRCAHCVNAAKNAWFFLCRLVLSVWQSNGAEMLPEVMDVVSHSSVALRCAKALVGFGLSSTANDEIIVCGMSDYTHTHTAPW